MNFTVENLEFFLLIVVRMASFIATAPFFSQRQVPRKVKASFSIILSTLIFSTIEYHSLVYEGVMGYAFLVVKESLVGILIGFVSNICFQILSFSGHMIDMEIGFSMVNELDPSTNLQSSITSNLYSNFVMLIMMTTYMHHYILRALLDTYDLIPIGQAIFRLESIKIIIVEFMADFFIIGFRIILPVFAATLVVNAILGILAKVAPQMNMFVIGLQLKIFVGLFVLLIVIALIPQVSDLIFEEMQKMIRLIVASLSKT